MNPVELRYKIHNALRNLSDVGDLQEVAMVSPVPGQPIKVRVSTVDPLGALRKYTISITED